MIKIFILLLITILNCYVLFVGKGGLINYFAIICLSISIMLLITTDILEKRNEE